MISAYRIGSVVIKVFKLVVNIAVLFIYSKGYAGEFLGIGGTWNLNEEKNVDVEIIGSGVMVGFLIYTIAQLLSHCLKEPNKRDLSEAIMNFVGIVMWISVGGIALHYWHGYTSEYNRRYYLTEKKYGLAVGYLSFISSALCLLDTIRACIHFAKDKN